MPLLTWSTASVTELFMIDGTIPSGGSLVLYLNGVELTNVLDTQNLTWVFEPRDQTTFGNWSLFVKFSSIGTKTVKARILKTP